jgi:hypothetical protein
LEVTWQTQLCRKKASEKLPATPEKSLVNICIWPQRSEKPEEVTFLKNMYIMKRPYTIIAMTPYLARRISGESSRIDIRIKTSGAKIIQLY